MPLVARSVPGAYSSPPTAHRRGGRIKSAHGRVEVSAIRLIGGSGVGRRLQQGPNVGNGEFAGVERRVPRRRGSGLADTLV
jgi:hypothetical protein